MKKTFTRALMMCATVLMVLVCFGCPREPEVVDGQNVTLTFKAMPYDAIGATVSILNYDSNGNYINISSNVATISAAEQTVSYHVNIGVSYLKCELYNNGHAYSCIVSLNQNTNYVVNGYWYIENQTYTRPLYAPSAEDVVEVNINDPRSFVLRGKPFVLLKVSGVAGHKLRMDIALADMEVYCSSNLSKILKWDDPKWYSHQARDEVLFTRSSSEVNTDFKYINPASDENTLYFFFRPYAYAKYNDNSLKSYAIFNIVDTTLIEGSQLKNSSIMREVQHLSDTKLLFAGSDGLSALSNNYDSSSQSDEYYTGNKLYTYDISTGTTTPVTMPAGLTGKIKNVIPYSNGYYFIAGTDVWYMDSSMNFDQKTTGKYVTGLCLYGTDKLFLMEAASDSESTATPMVYSLETNKNLSSTAYKTGTTAIKNGSSFTYVDGKVCYIDSSNHLRAVWWNANEQQSSSNDVNIKSPLLTYGTNVIEGEGRVYSPSTLEKISNKSISIERIKQSISVFNGFDDIISDGDYFYTLSNYHPSGYGTFVDIYKWNKSDLTAPVAGFTLWDKIGADLTLKDGTLYVSWTSHNPVRTESRPSNGYDRYYQVGVTKLNLNLSFLP